MENGIKGDFYSIWPLISKTITKINLNLEKKEKVLKKEKEKPQQKKKKKHIKNQ